MIVLQKLWKNFLFPSSPLFLSVSHCFRAWSKINLKVHNIINCLNKNLVIHLAWYVEKEEMYSIETLSIDRVTLWKKMWNIFMVKSCSKCAPKVSPWPLFVLVNNLKQSLHARNSFKNKIFWKGIVKNLLKS